MGYLEEQGVSLNGLTSDNISALAVAMQKFNRRAEPFVRGPLRQASANELARAQRVYAALTAESKRTEVQRQKQTIYNLNNRISEQDVIEALRNIGKAPKEATLKNVQNAWKLVYSKLPKPNAANARSSPPKPPAAPLLARMSSHRVSPDRAKAQVRARMRALQVRLVNLKPHLPANTKMQTVSANQLQAALNQHLARVLSPPRASSNKSNNDSMTRKRQLIDERGVSLQNITKALRQAGLGFKTATLQQVNLAAGKLMSRNTSARKRTGSTGPSPSAQPSPKKQMRLPPARPMNANSLQSPRTTNNAAIKAAIVKQMRALGVRLKNLKDAGHLPPNAKKATVSAQQLQNALQRYQSG